MDFAMSLGPVLLFVGVVGGIAAILAVMTINARPNELRVKEFIRESEANRNPEIL